MKPEIIEFFEYVKDKPSPANEEQLKQLIADSGTGVTLEEVAQAAKQIRDAQKEELDLEDLQNVAGGGIFDGCKIILPVLEEDWFFPAKGDVL